MHLKLSDPALGFGGERTRIHWIGLWGVGSEHKRQVGMHAEESIQSPGPLTSLYVDFRGVPKCADDLRTVKSQTAGCGHGVRGRWAYQKKVLISSNQVGAYHQEHVASLSLPAGHRQRQR